MIERFISMNFAFFQRETEATEGGEEGEEENPEGREAKVASERERRKTYLNIEHHQAHNALAFII